MNDDEKSPLNLTENNGEYTLKDTTQNAEMHTQPLIILQMIFQKSQTIVIISTRKNTRLA